MTILLVLSAILGLNALMLFSYWFGVRVGRRCHCCNLEMDCRFCVAAKCPNATRHE